MNSQLVSIATEAIVPLSNDPLNRWWVQFNVLEPAFAQFKETLVALLAFDSGSQPLVCGTGFIVADGIATDLNDGKQQSFAVAITAGHVFDQARRHQKPIRSTAPGLPPEPGKLSVDPRMLRAIHAGDLTQDMCIVVHAEWAQAYDAGLFVILQQAGQQHRLRFRKVGVQVTMPSIDTEVFVSSWWPRRLDEFHFDAGPKSQGIEIERNIVVRKGVVTGVWPSGRDLLGIAAPTFETSVPVEPGMSGGFAYLPGPDGTQICACGIVSSGTEQALGPTANMQERGTSYFTTLNASLSLSVGPLASGLLGKSSATLIELLTAQHESGAARTGIS